LKGTISIPERSSVAWIPKVLKEAGFVGDIPYLLDAATAVLIHPRASLDDVERSLQVLLEDIKIRKRLRKEAEP